MSQATHTPQRHAQRFAAFAGKTLLSRGDLVDIVFKTKAYVESDNSLVPIIFDTETGEQLDFDFGASNELLADQAREWKIQRSSEPELAADPTAPRSVGRPKLGVVAREVTLLPRHWDWLANQQGGASVALRKLVEQASRTSAAADRKRTAQNQCYRFISALAGDLPGFEEASRALFAADAARFAECLQPWPAAIREIATALAQDALHCNRQNIDKTD